MNSRQAIERRVIARINKEIGSDFKKLHRASVVSEHYKERLTKLHEKLDYQNETNTSSFKAVINDNKLAGQSLDFQREKLTIVGNKLLKKIKESKTVLMGTQDDLVRIRKLQLLMRYLRILQDIQETTNSLTHAIKGKDEAKMVNIYLTLYEEHDEENSIIGRLNGVDAPYLKLYAIQTASYWYKVLKKRFSDEFEAVLKAMRWGAREDNSLTYEPAVDQISKAQLLAEYLFLLKTPEEEDEQLETITSSIICHPVSVVTQFLLAPYRQRFIYHFTGTRKTNRLDKPEWFFTQVLNWGKEAHLFVGKTFQPSAVRAGHLDFNIRLEFMRGLVQLTIEKLAADIQEISRDEYLFAHLLDETFAFESELRDTFGYPPSFPSAISAITQPVYLLKWISLEERFNADKMDLILQAENPWELVDPNVFDDELKVPKCANQFVRLLEAVKDRYCCLIQPGHQLQFLTLQLELIDSFRMRLVQLYSNRLVDTMPVLNALNYVKMVLSEWGENVHYLHLHAALVGPNSDEFNSVFDNPVKELDHWADQLMKNLATKAVNEIKAKTMSYRRDNWSTVPEQSMREPFILSQTAGDMFYVMITTLRRFERGLSVNIFSMVVRIIAKQIDHHLYDSMVMYTKFSPAGAAQLNFDLTRNLFPLFGQYNKKPEYLFKRLHDANLLLNAARGTALLLYDTLKGNTSNEDRQKTLKELGIIHLKSAACIEVLERRTDIRIL